MGGKRVASLQLPAVSKFCSVPICSWGQIWEMVAPLHQLWGDHLLTLSGAGGAQGEFRSVVCKPMAARRPGELLLVPL